jgi:hypothetical protein
MAREPEHMFFVARKRIAEMVARRYTAPAKAG